MQPMILDSFEIVGFRTFPSLELPKLGRANLVVGRNGVGKTTLLEAFDIYAVDGDQERMSALLTRRGEAVTVRTCA